MVRYPRVFKKAQEEIDRVVGSRFPDYADRDSLPYLECVLKEVHRFVQNYSLAHYVSDFRVS